MMKRTFTPAACLLMASLFFSVLFAGQLRAQSAISIPVSGTVTENFNTFFASPSANEVATGVYVDNPSMYFGTDNGSSINNGTYNLGNSGDRAIGARYETGPNQFYGVRFVNNTGKTINCLQVAYDVEQWDTRDIDGNITTHTFAYKTGTNLTALTGGFTGFSALNARSGPGGLLNCSAPPTGNAAITVSRPTQTITGLNIAPGGEIFLRWRAQNRNTPPCFNQNALGVDNLTVTVIETQPPTALMTAVTGCSPSYSVNFSWTAPLIPPSMGYLFEFALNPTFTPPLVSSGSTSVPSHMEMALAPGTYYFRVRSNGMCGMSTWVTRQIDLPVTNPTLTVGASPTTVCLNQTTTLVATLPPNVSFSSFQWEESANITGPFTPVTGATTVPFVLTASAAGTMYYRLMAQIGSCPPPLIVSTNVITLTTTAAVPPQNLRAAGTNDCPPTRFTAQWDAPAGPPPTNYTFQIDDDINFGSLDLNVLVTGLSRPSGVLTNVPGLYYYRVRANYSTGCPFSPWIRGQYMLPAAFTPGTSISVPNAVCVGSSSTLELVNSNSLVQWETQGLCSPTGPWNPIVGATTYTYALPNFTVAGNYCYRAVVRYGNTCGPVNRPVSVDVAPLPIIDAGPTQTFCGTVATLAAVLSPNVSGIWTVDQGSASFADTNNPTTTVSGLSTTQDNILRFTGSNPFCAPVFDTVILRARANPSSANILTNGPVPTCNTSEMLMGAAPTVGVPSWIQVGTVPSVATLTPSGSNVTVSNLNVAGTYTFRYRITNAPCPTTSNTIQVIKAVAGVPGMASAVNTNICVGNSANLFSMGASGTLQWQKANTAPCTGGWVDIVGATTPNFTTALLNVGDVSCYRLKASGGSCPDQFSNTVNLTINPVSVGGTAGPSQTVCASGNGGTVTATGFVGNIVGWEKSTDNITWIPIIAATNPTFTFSNILVDTYYRLVVESLGCSNAMSSPALVQVIAAPIGGNIGGNQNLCAGNTASFTLSSHMGMILRWEFSTNGFSTIGGTIANTTPNLTTIPLNATTSYRAVVGATGCPEAYSSIATVNITNGGMVTPALSEYCGSSPNVPLVSTGHTGSIIGWEQSTDCVNFIPLMTVPTSAMVTIPAGITTTTCFRMFTINPTCPYSTTARVTINPNTVGGSIAGAPANAVCANAGTYTLLLSGQTGDVLRWERSIDNQATWQNIGNANVTNLVVSNITATTSYRVRVRSGNCPMQFSNVATVAIAPSPVAGTILNTNANTLCAGSSGVLTLNGFVGTVQRWETSTDNFSTVNTITTTNPFLIYNLISVTTSFRAVVSTPTCAAVTSAPYTITVTPSTIPGTITGPMTVCSGVNSGTLTLSGNLGNVLQWQSSTTSFNTITTLTNTTLAQTFSNLTATTQFRALVQSGGCPARFSQPVEVVVIPPPVAGIVNGTSVVCGNTNTATLNLTGHQGQVVRWESSINNFATSNTLQVASATLIVNNLTASTQFRAVIGGANCPEVFSNTFDVAHAAGGNGGTIAAFPPIVCANAGSFLVLSGQTGNVTKWEFSDDNCSGPWTGIANISSALSTPPLLRSRCYRAIVQFATCPPETSATQLVTVVGGSNATFVVRNVSCRGSADGQITITGNTPNGQFSIDGGLTFGTNNVFSNLNPGIYNLVVRDALAPACATVFSNVAITEPATLLSIVSIQPITLNCANPNGGAIDLTVTGGTAPYTYLWSNGSQSEDVANVPAGIYTVTVTDANGCIKMASATLTNGSNITVTPIISNARCFGGSSGSINVNVSGGIAPYNFSWSVSGPNTSSRTGLSAGNYTVNIVDAAGCTAFRSYTVSQPLPIIVNTATSPTACPTSLAGSAVASAIGGTAPFNFLWSNGGTTSLISNLAAGTYTVTITDANGCSSVNTATVGSTQNAPATPTVAATPATICGNGTSTLGVANPSNLTYTWYSDAVNNIIIGSGPNLTVSPTATTTYYVSAFNPQNPTCTSQRGMVTVTVSTSSVGGTTAGGTTVCPNSNSGTISLSGNIGSIVRWETSTNNFQSVSQTVNNTSASLNFVNLTQTTSYRAVVQSGNCAEAFSSASTVTVSAACGGIVATPNTISLGTIVPTCGNTPQSYSVSGTGLTGSVNIVAPANFELSLSAAGNYSNILSLPSSNSVLNATTVFVRLVATAQVGSYSGNIVHSGTNVSTVNVSVSGSIAASALPDITVNPLFLDLGTSPLAVPSSAMSYTLTVTNPQVGPISINVPPPFEISQSANGPFVSSLTLNATSCQTVTATIFVRFTPNTTGQQSATVSHTSGPASITLVVAGTGMNSSAQSRTTTNPNWTSQQDVDNTLGPNQAVWQVNAFNNLQTAVNNTMTNGEVVLNGPNHRSNNTTIPRPMTIRGSGPTQTILRPMSQIRNTYSSTNPANALDNNFQHNHGFIVQSSDVVIRDLTISGDPNVDCDSRFGVGIINDNRTNVPYNNIRIENVNIEFVYSKGIQLFNAGAIHTIRGVRVEDVCLRFDTNPNVFPTAAGIYVNDPAIIENSTILKAGTGIWVEGDIGATAGQSSIRNNVISEMEAAGIFADLRPNTSVNNLVIAGNTITAIGSFGIDAKGFDNVARIGGPNSFDRNVIFIQTRPNRGPGVGVRISESVGTMVQNLEVNAAGLESGMWLMNNTSSTQPIRVTQAILRRIGVFATNPQYGQSNGVFMSDLGQYSNGNDAESYVHMWDSEISGFNMGFFTNENGRRDVDAIIGGNNVANPSVSIFNNDEGIRANGRSRVIYSNNRRSVRNNRVGIYVYGGELVMEGSRVASNQIGVLVEDKIGYESITNMTNNLFEGNTQKNVINNGARSIDASYNYWGTSNASLVNASITQGTGGVDYSPWLATDVETDNNPINGFDGDRTVVHVDDNSFQTGSLSLMQEAINDPTVQTVVVEDGVYIGSANVDRSITFTNDGAAPNPTFANLTVNGNAAMLSMTGSFDVATSLNLTNGRINVNMPATLQVVLGGTVNGGNSQSYVIGNLARQSVSTTTSNLVYPIGSMTAYRPATLAVAQVTNGLNSYTGSVMEPNTLQRSLPTGVISSSTVRAWNFSQSGPAPIANASLEGAYGADDPGSSTPADLVVLKDNGPTSSAWDNQGGFATGSPNGTVITTLPFNNLGTFVLGRKASGPIAGQINLMNVVSIGLNSAVPLWTSLNCTGVQYELRYRVKGASTAYKVATPTATFVSLTNLQQNTTYEISVRGRCPNDVFTPWSTGTVTEFTTLSAGDCSIAGTPPAPGNVFVNMITANSVRLNWRSTTNASNQGYIISFGDAQLNPNNWPQFVTCNPNTTFMISGLTPGRTYGVRIRTNCSNCTTALSSVDRRSSFSDTEYFTTLSSKDAQNEVATGWNLNVYPNPSQGKFSVRIDSDVAGTAKLTLSDLSGRVLFEQDANLTGSREELNLSLEGYSAGLYLLRVLHNGTEQHVKVIIE